MTDPRHDQLFEQFSQDDREFLAGIFVRFPKIEENFCKYLSISPEQRMEQAQKDMAVIPRTGWVRKKIKNPETLAEHSDHLVSLVKSKAVPAGVYLSHAVSMASIHDLPEVIMTDFTPADENSGKITADEKSRLELLAFEVLVNNANMERQFREFLEQKTAASQWLNDLDKIASCIMALKYEAKYPEKIGLSSEFFAYAGGKIKTVEGKKIFAELVDNHAVNRDSYRVQHVQETGARQK